MKIMEGIPLCGIVQLANSNALRFWNWSFTIKLQITDKGAKEARRNS
jgi:hypothetical protein